MPSPVSRWTSSVIGLTVRRSDQLSITSFFLAASGKSFNKGSVCISPIYNEACLRCYPILLASGQQRPENPCVLSGHGHGSDLIPPALTHLLHPHTLRIRPFGR